MNTIEVPEVRDAGAVARMHLRAWYETYDQDGSGVDAAWIAQNLGHLGTAAGIDGWAAEIAVARREPERVFCRIVRTITEVGATTDGATAIDAVTGAGTVRADGDAGGGAPVVGFLYGRRADTVTLGPMYLLAEAQGTGVADLLMGEFLGWAGAAPIRLWVSEFNTRAVRFYTRYGFVATGERELWRDRLRNVRMVRPAGG
ncbi:GNAT family N-acetyltransferase [Actinocatenispora sera]|uniref:N-acetyltransferase domain-containing protein n=1 Tax=Actinocatenispora sera TaxID=390989 RepID=A0A810KWC1_9ACTN|nr:GNAT family N-acetyltransferase [Actinocatenispora sera]BCJ27513.1 hypothetical protein Asera_16210 [Actinocatenispora sera]